MTNDSPPGKSIGKGMLTVSWILVLIVLALWFSKWEKKQYNPNMDIEGSASENSRTIVLKQNNMGHYVASGLVNNQPVTFMLDTGATQVAVPANIAKQLNLSPGARFNVATANGIVEVRATRIEELKLGTITLHDVRASINPGLENNEILLGMSALKQLDFSQKGKQLTITQNLWSN